MCEKECARAHALVFACVHVFVCEYIAAHVCACVRVGVHCYPCVCMCNCGFVCVTMEWRKVDDARVDMDGGWNGNGRVWDERYVEDAGTRDVAPDGPTPIDAAARQIRHGIRSVRLGQLRGLARAAEASQHEDCRRVILPLVEEVSDDVDGEVRLTVAEGIPELATYFLQRDDEEACQELLQCACAMLADEDMDVQGAAEDAVVEIMDHNQGETAREAVVQLLQVLVAQEEADPRKTGARLVRRTAEKLGKECRAVLETCAFTMAKDEEHEARAEAAGALCTLFQHTEHEAGLVQYWPTLQRLSRDTMWNVRKTFAECITKVAKQVPAELLVDTVLFLLVDASKAVQIATYQQFGELLHVWGPSAPTDTVVRTFCTVVVEELAGDERAVQACASSFPQVAATIGRRRWQELGHVFHYLRSSRHESVRCIVAKFLHELVDVLDVEDVLTDIQPTLSAFLVDTEKVREAVLEDIVRILNILPEDQADDIAHLLAEVPTFSDENSANWRMRRALAIQLGGIARHVSYKNVEQNVVPLALHLWADPVADVRLAAGKELGAITARLLEQGQHALHEIPLVQVILKYASSKSFYKRALFADACSRMIGPLSEEDFASVFLPLLVQLASDKIPNVRLVVAMALKDMTSEWKPSLCAVEFEEMKNKLQKDADKDVSYYATTIQ